MIEIFILCGVNYHGVYPVKLKGLNNETISLHNYFCFYTLYYSACSSHRAKIGLR